MLSFAISNVKLGVIFATKRRIKNLREGKVTKLSLKPENFNLVLIHQNPLSLLLASSILVLLK